MLNFLKIAEFMKEAHKGQTRSDGTPYDRHPLEVMVKLEDDWGIHDENILAAALLHDVIEDTEYTHGDIAALTNGEVADIVLELTNKHPEGTPFKIKNQALIEHAGTLSYEAKCIKIVDRWCNVNDSIKSWPEWRIKRYAQAGLDLLEAMKPWPGAVKELAEESAKLYTKLVSK